MKKLVFSILLLVEVGFAYAQTKGSVLKAEAYLKAGKLAEAKTEVENALNMELAKLKKKGKNEIGKGKTYLVQGKVYQAIALSEAEADKKLMTAPIKKTMEAYGMVKKVEKKNTMNYIAVYGPALPGSKPLILDFYEAFYIKAVNNFNDKNYSEATKYFENALIIQPKDTIVGQNIYLCARNDQKEDLAKKYALKLIEWGCKKPDLYSFLADFEMKKENYDQALKILRKGIVANPSNLNLMGMEINIYIKSDRANEAIASLDKAIEKSPNDTQLHLNKGLLYRDLGNLEEAEKSLNKVIEINPKEVGIYKEIGAIFYNATLDVNNKINNLELNKRGEYLDNIAADKLQKKINELYKKTLPYWGKFIDLKPDDRETLELLEFVYLKLGRKADAENISKKLDTIPEN